MIKPLDTWSLPDTVNKPNGYEFKTLPETSAENMFVFMNKINELIDEVNALKEQIKQIKS